MLSCSVYAQPQLTKDINTDLDGIAFPPQFQKAGDHIYFPLFTDNNYSLFRTDGTAPGTSILFDDADPRSIFMPEGRALGSDFLFFAVQHGTTRLYKVSSGDIQAHQVKDFGKVLDLRIVESKNHFLFLVKDWEAGTTVIYKSDGTDAGTIVVTALPKDFYIWSSFASDSYTYIVLFSSQTSIPSVLRTDGTQAGTVTVWEWDASNISVDGAGVMGDKFFFVIDNYTTHRNELYVTNGTLAGTSMIKQLDGQPFANSAVVLGNDLVFGGHGGTWKTNGTSGGTVRIDFRIAIEATLFNGAYYAVGATASSAGAYALLKYDGMNMTVVKEMAGTDTWYGHESPIRVVNNKLVFSFYSPTTGVELGVSDGTQAGTVLLKDIFPGTSSSEPKYLTPMSGNKIVFVADDGVHGRELWTTDGTEAGTQFLKDVFTGTANSVPLPYYSTPQIIKLGNKVSFVAGTRKHPLSSGTLPPVGDVYISDGTANGTQRVFEPEANANTTWAGAVYSGTFNGHVYYEAGSKLIKLSEATGTVSVVKDIKDDFIGTLGGPWVHPGFVTNGKLVFPWDVVNLGFKWWVTDGTSEGTKVLKADINPSFEKSIVLNGKPIFSASNAANGIELWTTDGTDAGTTIIKDILPGTGNSNPTGLIQLGNKVIFGANTESGYSIYVTDGTANGTQKIVVSGIVISSFVNPVVSGGYVYFFNITSTTVTLAKTNGVETKTVYSFPMPKLAEMVALNGNVYTAVNDGEHGVELGVFNSNDQLQVLDFVPGAEGSYPSVLRAFGDRIWFAGRTSPSEGTLWRTSGTLAGSGNIGNLAPLTMEIVEGRLYFFAYSPQYGAELFSHYIGKAEQEITFQPVPNKLLTDPAFELVASSTSGLPITFTAVSADKVSLSGNVVTILKPGSVILAASQPGNDSFTAATAVPIGFCIKPSTPTITTTIDQPATKTLQSSSTIGNRWYRNGTEIPEATSQTLVVTEAGSYSVKVRIDACESDASDAKVITVVGLEQESNFHVYPNPVTDELHVDLSESAATIHILDMIGKPLLTKSANGGKHVFDVRGFAKGMYLLKIEGQTLTTKRILKN